MVKINGCVEQVAPDVAFDEDAVHEGVRVRKGLEDESRRVGRAHVSVGLDELCYGKRVVTETAGDEEVSVELG